MQLTLVIVLVLGVLRYGGTLPHKELFSQREFKVHEDRRNLNYYNFEELPKHNCEHNHQQQQHHYDRLNYDASQNNAENNLQPYSQYPPLYNSRQFQMPQDRYHRPEYLKLNEPNYTPNKERNQNEHYADINGEAEDDSAVKFGFEPRTVFDAPRNCKQTNFKGKCIKY